jgi:UDP-N-acetylglucosamine/UDP-N-acetylgalactosamine diphosphorylase
MKRLAMSETPDRQSAAALLRAHGQEHVLRWLDSLAPAAQTRLLSQIAALDLDWLARTFASELEKVQPADIAPYREVIRPGRDPRRDDALRAGEAALKAGRVGTLLVAGGQGTRLGFDGPKGAFPVGAVSGRTLYQIHAERLVALGRRHGVVPPLYLMTSDANHEATCAMFAEHDHFGLPRDRVLIFQQGLAPAVNEEGLLLLNAKDHVVMTPNGNGGLFAAMRDGGAFEHMARSGVDVISYIQVDNPLARSCDPLFVGYHLLGESDFSCKSIDKVGPKEKVGCYASVRGKLRIVEYTELPPALAEQRDEDGELLYGQSNPGLFVWSRSFAEAQAARRDLPFHKAHKKIPHIDEQGVLVKPSTPCGYKFESFAMDTLPDAPRSLVMWCDRDAEFAPVKNASGVDSPESARRLMTRLHGGWIRAAGGTVADEKAQIEINPLHALDADELKARLPDGFVVRGDVYLRAP